jgi:hypothetical protein
MNENGKFPDYAEVWVNAHRARDVYVALSLALITAAFTQGWKSLQQQQSPSDKDAPLPLAKAAEPADPEAPIPSKRTRSFEKASFDEERV